MNRTRFPQDHRFHDCHPFRIAGRPVPGQNMGFARLDSRPVLGPQLSQPASGVAEQRGIVTSLNAPAGLSDIGWLGHRPAFRLGKRHSGSEGNRSGVFG